MEPGQAEIPKKELMDNAEELKQRITSFSFEVMNYFVPVINENQRENTEEISDKIYKVIIELTNAQTRIQIPKKFKYWF